MPFVLLNCLLNYRLAIVLHFSNLIRPMMMLSVWFELWVNRGLWWTGREAV